jgi:hypothetical protein
MTKRFSLKAFEAEVRSAAALAWTEDAPYRPDPHACRFCPVKTTCEALKTNVEAEIDAVFGSLSDSPESMAARLETERMAEFLKWRPTVESLFAAVAAELLRRAEAGEEVPHYKIVEGRRRRAWKDEREAAEWLSFLGLDDDQIWVRSLISPHQAELVLRAKRAPMPKAIAAEVTSVAGPRTLAPMLDPRSALVGNADVFEPVASEDDDDLS